MDPCNWLVPLRTIVLNCPPEEWPYSAENWFCNTVNSATASFGMNTSGPVTDLLLLSIPSIVKLLLRGRCPPTEGPVPAPTPPLLATPELNSERLITPSPIDAVGRSAAAFVSKVFVTCAVVVSIETADSCTSTEAETCPTCKVIFAVAILFSSTPTSLSEAG